MKNSLFIVSCFIIYGSALSANSPPRRPSNISKLKVSINHIRLYNSIIRKYNGSNKENILISPFVFDIGMGILKYAAPESCEKSLSIRGMSKVKSITNAIIRLTEPKRPNITIELSNSVYLDDKHTLSDKVKSRMNADYQTNLYKVDFARNATLIEKQINDKVFEDTHKLIKEVVSPGSLNSNTQAVIINTLYFEGNWTKPFDRFEKRKFNGKTKSSEVTMLSGIDDFEFIPLSNGRLFFMKKYYYNPRSRNRDDRFVFAVYEGVEPLRGDLDSSDAKIVKVRLTMPKIKQTTELDVLDKFNNETHCLKSQGLTRFTKERLDISTVKQKNRFETTLAGSKGASVMTTELSSRFGEDDDDVKEILMDKPFSYYVINRGTEAYLFAGTYFEPDTTIDAIDE